jgi:hypothetical protein
MKNKPILILVVIFLLTLIAIVFGKALIKTQTIDLENNLDKEKFSCDKEDNCCVTNEDCQYVWFTGACNTPEYITKIQKEAEAVGRRNGEAPPRENVTCTCELNKCVTHN